jgi:ribosomal protein L37AE/L43A
MGIWREHGGGGRGGRRASVNIIPTSSGSPVDESKFCPRCSVQLSYLKEEDIWACVKCAWNLPRHLLKEEPSPSLSPSLSSSPNQNKVVTVDMAEAESADSIPTASKGTRANELKKKNDPFSYLRKEDDAWLEEKGMTLVSEQIDLPTGHADTISSEDLKAQKERRRRSRW